jgi:hypothetical protein
LHATADIGGDGEAAPGRTYRFPLPPHPIAAEQARLLTKMALADWSLAAAADDALLVAAELVTNAAKLGEVFHITLSRQGGMVLIEVRDGSEALPDRRRRSIDQVDGRGLLLVEACAKDWGWRLEEQGGKTVWAITSGAPQRETVSPPSIRR